MDTIEINKLASPVSLYLGALQSSSKRPGAVDALPEVTLVRPKVCLEEAHVAAYARVCGFCKVHGVPITYPQMLAFPLAMTFFGSKFNPWPAMGTVHLGNCIRQHRHLNVLQGQLHQAITDQQATTSLIYPLRRHVNQHQFHFAHQLNFQVIN